MHRYASLVGLKFNEPKTGSASIDGKKHAGLPQGDIKWGFLKFDDQKARFVIDQDMVMKEVKELRRQLGSTKSVFGWVNAWNKYMAFFLRNFGGRPANCFGKVHVDESLKVLVAIQRELFSDEKSGGPVGHLRTMIKDRFGVDDLPEGYFFSPIDSGGLELRDPLIELIATSDIEEFPEQRFIEQKNKDDLTAYENLKTTWEQSTSNGQSYYDSSAKGEFMPFEEYVLGRETRLLSWRSTYMDLLSVIEPDSAYTTPAISQAKIASQSARNLDEYGEWVIATYGDELVRRFGGLDIVDPSLIPIGMVQLFRNSRMKLDQ
jgi:hypothetical protein